MIDQVIIPVRELSSSREFFEKVLAPLQYRLVVDTADRCGFSVMQKPDFWIRLGGAATPPVHITFTCRDRAAVDAFHQAATAAGAAGRSAPAELGEAHPHSYAATVLDPDGNSIEAVCHRPQ
jgi:catechol 2,3-dioxygenase-like lactoylglutathione lyase family enzyme